MMMLDERLRSEGSTAACTRAEVELAFAYLTSPRTGIAVWAGDAHDAIVIRAPDRSLVRTFSRQRSC